MQTSSPLSLFGLFLFPENSGEKSLLLFSLWCFRLSCCLDNQLLSLIINSIIRLTNFYTWTRSIGCSSLLYKQVQIYFKSSYYAGFSFFSVYCYCKLWSTDWLTDCVSVGRPVGSDTNQTPGSLPPLPLWMKSDQFPEHSKHSSCCSLRHFKSPPVADGRRGTRGKHTLQDKSSRKSGPQSVCITLRHCQSKLRDDTLEDQREDEQRIHFILYLCSTKGLYFLPVIFTLFKFCCFTIKDSSHKAWGMYDALLKLYNEQIKA